MRVISIFLVINLIFCNTGFAEVGLNTLAASSRLGEALPGVERYYSVLALHRKVVGLGIESLDDTGGVKCLIFPDRKDARQKAYYYITPDYVLRVSSIAEIDDSFGRVLEGLGRGEDVGEIKPYYLKRYAITPENRGFINSCLVQIYPEWAISRLNEILDRILDLEERLLIDLDSYFDSLSVTELKEKIRLQREQQIAAGFIDEEQTGDKPIYKFTQDGINYAIQFNPGRLRRMQPLAEEYETIILNSIEDAEEIYRVIQASGGADRIMDRINEIGGRYRLFIEERKGLAKRQDFCPICPEFLPQIEKGFTYMGFVVYPNPFPIFNGHLTLAYKDHKTQQIDKAGIISALEFVSSAPDYKVIYNHNYAGASIANHYHLQAFPGALPIEEVPLDDISHEDGIILSQAGSGYPARVLVLTGRDKESLAEKVSSILKEIEDKGQTFNLLFTRLPNGDLRIFIFLRNPKEEIPSEIFNNPFGTMEMAGMIISSEPDYQGLLRKAGGSDELLREEVLRAISKASATDVQALTLNISKDGVLVFDVDGTILEKKNTLENEPGMLKVLLELLQDGFRIAFISGNSRSEQLRRVWGPIRKRLAGMGAMDKAENLIIYANGSATKIRFDNSGNEILDNDYNKGKGIEPEDIDIIKGVLEEMLGDKFGLNEEELAEWRRWFSHRDDFPNVRFDLSWANGVPVVSAEEIKGVLSSVWIETRDGVQISIKLLPKLPRDIRQEVIDRIEGELKKRGRSGRLTLRPGGFASIDINRAGVDKATALKDLQIEKGTVPIKKGGQSPFLVYFGDEFGERGNDLPVLEVPGVKVFSVGPDVIPGINWIGKGPEATKRFLRETLEDLRFKKALGVLGVSPKELRTAIERFMGVKDLVEDQRIPEYRDEAEERARKVLRQAAIRLAGLGKPISEIIQEEFNSVLGISQVVLAGGFASRYHRLIHKGLGPMEISGDTNMRLAIWGSYKSPGTKPVIAISNRLILWLLKDEIIEELINSGKDTEPFMIGRLQELGLKPEIKNGIIQSGVLIPDSIIDPDKKALFFTSDADIIYFHHYGYGDAFCDSLMTLRERGLLDKTRYKQYVFSEMPEAGLQDRSAASFIAYLEAVANDNLITMGTKEVDPKTQANDILTKKGSLFLKDGRLVAFTDAPYMPNYRKEKLRKVLKKLGEWEKLSQEEKAEIRRHFAVTENGKLLISANCGVVRNDIVDYFGEYYQYDEDGNKPGFVKVEVTEDGQRVGSYQLDSKTGEPIYIAPDLVETVSRVWQMAGLNIHDIPIGYVNTGNAPSSIKDMDSQKRFNARWLSHVMGQMPFSGPNILRKQLFYTAIMGSRNYRVLLDIFNGDRDLLRKNINETARYLSIEPVQVLLGILGHESFYSLGLREDKEEKPLGDPHVVTLTGGTAIGSFLLEAIHKLGIEVEEGELLLASLLPTLDDGGSTYEIITNLDRHGYGVFPPLGDQANVLLAGLASLDKIRYILGDSGRVRDDGEESLENILVLLLKRTFNDTALQKSPDLLYFASNILAASRIIDEYYIRKGILNLKGASIRNLFVLAILHEYGLLRPDKSPGMPAIEDDAGITSYNDALRALAGIAGVKDGIAVPVSFDPATMYARYEDNVLIRREKGGEQISLIKPGEEIDINGEKWILEEKGDETFLIDINNPLNRYILANDGSGRGKKIDETEFHPLSIGGLELYIRPRLVVMQTNITETANFSRLVEVGLLDRFRTGKPAAGRFLHANPMAVQLIDSARDMIIIGPGNIFTSILPHLMVPDIVAALKRARLQGKRVVWIMNGTIDNETVGLSVSDIIDFVEKISQSKLEEIFTNIIFTSYDETKATTRLKRVLYQSVVIETREPGAAAREAKKSRGPLVPTREEMEQIWTRGIVVHQDELLVVREVRDRISGKISYRIIQDPDKVGEILKRINEENIHSQEIEEDWEIISFNPEKKQLQARVRYYGKGILLGELHMDIDPIAASINTCWLKAHKEGQGLATEMVARAYVVGYYISNILGWDTQWAHAYFTLSGNEEREADYWSPAKWTWLLEERPEVRIIERLGLVAGEVKGKEHLDGRYGRYNDRRCPLADMEGRVSEVLDSLKKSAMEIVAGLIKARDSPTNIRLAGNILPWVEHSDKDLLDWAKDMIDSGLDIWHIDMMDGDFVPQKVDARDRLKLLSQKTDIPIEIHMMVKEPTVELIMDYIKTGLRPGRDTILVHLEAFSSSSNLQDFIQKVKGLGLRINLAINPKTPVDAVRPYLSILDRVTIMTVEPGLGGQEFINYCLGKIEELRGLIEIEVEGGVDEYNSRQAVEAGAGVLAVGAGLAKTRDPSYAVWRLKGGYLVFQGHHQMFVRMDKIKLRLIGLGLENFGILDELVHLKKELDSRLKFTEYPEHCDEASERVKGILERNGFKDVRIVRRENLKLPEGRIGVAPHHHQYVEVDIAGVTFIIDLTADQFEVREFKPAAWKNEYYDLGVVVIPKSWVEAHKDRFWMYTSGTQAPTSIIPNVAPDICREPAPPTGVGVVAAIRAAVAEAFPDAPDISGKVVAVQGAGGTGASVIKQLLGLDAIVIASDISVDTIDALRRELTGEDRDRFYYIVEERVGDGYTRKIMNPRAVYSFTDTLLHINAIGDGHVDVFVPCAIGPVLNPETIGELKKAGVKAVCGSCNNVLEDKERDSRLLMDAGITFVPDYIANAGGVIGVDGHLGHDISDAGIAKRIDSRVRDIIRQARAEGKTTQEIADTASRDFFERLEIAKRIVQEDPSVYDLREEDIVDKAGIVRVGTDVLNKKGGIKSDTRIKILVPTIDSLFRRGARHLILCAYFGRPERGDKNKDQRYAGVLYDNLKSGRPIADRLQELTGRRVHFIPAVDQGGRFFEDYKDYLSYADAYIRANVRPGELVFLDNLRFWDEEDKRSAAGFSDFAERLAGLGSFYVQEGYPQAHRPDSTVVSIADHFNGKAVFGDSYLTEIRFFNRLRAKLNKRERGPINFILAGVKIETKPGVISKITVTKRLLEKFRQGDYITLGGALAYTFIVAQYMIDNGIEEEAIVSDEMIKGLVGNSIVQRDLIPDALFILRRAKEKDVNVLLPVDHRVADKFENNKLPGDANISVIEGNIPIGQTGVDIGPKTEEIYIAAVKKSETILIAGPLGVIEDDRTVIGSINLVKAMGEVTERGAETIATGGETEALITKAGVSLSHVSIGGGAALEDIEKGGNLPGTLAVRRNRPKKIDSAQMQGSHIVRDAKDGGEERSIYSMMLVDIRAGPLRKVLDRLKDIYGEGIFSQVKKIQVVENLGGGGVYPDGRAPLASYKDGVLKIDELVFEYGEQILFEELEHEFLESIAVLIPGVTHALADVVSTFRNVKRFLELSFDDREEFLFILGGDNPIDPDGEYSALLRRLCEIRDVEEVEIIASIVRYVLRTKLYEKVRGELGLPEELARKIRDLEPRLDDALVVFDEIAKVKEGRELVDKVKRSGELTIRVIETPRGIRLTGTEAEQEVIEAGILEARGEIRLSEEIDRRLSNLFDSLISYDPEKQTLLLRWDEDINAVDLYYFYTYISGLEWLGEGERAVFIMRLLLAIVSSTLDISGYDAMKPFSDLILLDEVGSDAMRSHAREFRNYFDPSGDKSRAIIALIRGIRRDVSEEVKPFVKDFMIRCGYLARAERKMPRVIRTLNGPRIIGRVSDRVRRLIGYLVRNERLDLPESPDITRPRYIVVSKDREENRLEGILRKRYDIHVVTEIPKDAEFVVLVDPEDVGKWEGQNLLYLPLPYMERSLKLAAEMLLSDQKIAHNYVEGFYNILLDRTLSDKEVSNLFHKPWWILPDISALAADLIILREAISQLEKSA